MYLCVLATGTVSDVDGELEHGESVSLEFLAKIRIAFLVLLGFCGQVEEY